MMRSGSRVAAQQQGLPTQPAKRSRRLRFAAGARSLLAAAAAWWLLCAGAASAGQVTLAWDANTEPDLAGYRIHYGTISGTYTTSVSVGNVLTHTVLNLTDGGTYYFAATALDTYGNESAYSNEVSQLVAGSVEINLSGNGGGIADGDGSPAGAGHTDFGGAEGGGGTVTRTFTVQNSGTGALALGGNPIVAVGGANAADFTVTVQPSASVAAGGSTTFQVRFDPAASGTRSATLSIANSDADENPYNFAIQGAGTTAPEINLSGNGVGIADGDGSPAAADHTDFGAAGTWSGTVTRTFTIQNLGSGTLALTGTPLVAIRGAGAADFTVTVPPAASIPAGGSTTFEVRFDPSAGGTRGATLSIPNGDADESPYDFAIQGRGVAPPAAPRNVRASS